MGTRRQRATRGEKERYWQKHLSEWRESSLSQAEYCRVNNLSRRCFGYYKTKQRKKTSVVSFMPLQAIVPAKDVTVSTLKVILDDRFKIEVGDGFTPATLEKIVQTLRGV